MTKAKKDDKKDNKPDYSLLPKVFMDQVAYVMMAGAEKYGRYNYTKGHTLTQLLAAAERHIKQAQDGEDFDKNTSEITGVDIYHYANVCSNMLMILHQLQLGTLTDDRFKKEKETEEKEFVENTKREMERHWRSPVRDILIEYTVVRRIHGGEITETKELWIGERELHYHEKRPGFKILDTREQK